MMTARIFRLPTLAGSLLLKLPALLSPRVNWQAGQQVIQILRSTRELTGELTKREITAAHAGHGLGGLWAFVHPLVVVGVYLLIFGFVLGSRIEIANEFP